MAKKYVVGQNFRLKPNQFCPQCRKQVPPSEIFEEGVKCPRCGFFSWEDYKKYPKFTSIPEPSDYAQEPENLSKTSVRVKPGEKIPGTEKKKTTKKSKAEQSAERKKKSDVKPITKDSEYSTIFEPVADSEEREEEDEKKK